MLPIGNIWAPRAAPGTGFKTNEGQDMQICYPCPTTFLLPISPGRSSLA